MSTRCRVPSSVATPSLPRISCDSTLRVITRESPAVALAHLLQQRIHRARFGAVRHAQFVLRRRDAQRADHHRGERVGEFALEHRTFAGHHAIVLAALRNAGTAGKHPADAPAARPPKYPRVSSKFCVITVTSTFSAPRIRCNCRTISSTRMSEPVLRVPL